MPPKAKGRKWAFRCEICNTNFRTGDNLHKHLKTSKCMRGSILQSFIRQQRREACETSASYICGNCKISFHNGPDLELHLSSRECLGKQPTQTPVSNRPVPVADRSLNWPNSNFPYSCGHCQNVFHNAARLQQHIVESHGASQTPFSGSPRLVDPSSNWQTSNFTFTCGKCQQEFDSATSLQQHVYSNTCRAVSLFTCGICQATFKEPDILNNHLQLHGFNSSDPAFLLPETARQISCGDVSTVSDIKPLDTSQLGTTSNFYESEPAYSVSKDATDVGASTSVLETADTTRSSVVASQETNQSKQTNPDSITKTVSDDAQSKQETITKVTCTKRKSPEGDEIDNYGNKRRKGRGASASSPLPPASLLPVLERVSDPCSSSKSSQPGPSTKKAQNVNSETQKDLPNLGINAVCPSCNRQGRLTESGVVCDRCKLIFSTFKCEYCSEIFPDMKYLMEHLRVTQCCKKKARGDKETKPVEETVTVKIERVDSDSYEQSPVTDEQTRETDVQNDASQEPSEEQIRQKLCRFREFIKQQARQMNMSRSPSPKTICPVKDSDQEDEKQMDEENAPSKSELQEDTLVSSPVKCKSPVNTVVIENFPVEAEKIPYADNDLGNSCPQEDAVEKRTPPHLNPSKNVLEIDSFIESDSISEISDSSGFEEIEVDDDSFDDISIAVNEIRKEFPKSNIQSTGYKVVTPFTDTTASSKTVDLPVCRDNDKSVKAVPDATMNSVSESKKQIVPTKKLTSTFKTGVFVMESDEDSSDDDFDVTKKKHRKTRLQKKKKRIFSKTQVNEKVVTNDKLDVKEAEQSEFRREPSSVGRLQVEQTGAIMKKQQGANNDSKDVRGEKSSGEVSVSVTMCPGKKRGRKKGSKNKKDTNPSLDGKVTIEDSPNMEKKESPHIDKKESHITKKDKKEATAQISPGKKKGRQKGFTKKKTCKPSPDKNLSGEESSPLENNKSPNSDKKESYVGKKDKIKTHVEKEDKNESQIDEKESNDSKKDKTESHVEKKRKEESQIDKKMSHVNTDDEKETLFEKKEFLIEKKESQVEKRETHVEKKESHVEKKDLQVENRESHVEKKESLIEKKDSHVEKRESLEVMEDYICGECKQFFASISSLRKHLRTHCEELKEASVPEAAKDNSETVPDKDQFVCGICQRQTSTIEELAQHVQTHVTVKRFPCSVCEQTFLSLQTLQNHMKTHPPQPAEFVCGICSSTFSSSTGLEEHIISHSKTVFSAPTPSLEIVPKSPSNKDTTTSSSVSQTPTSELKPPSLNNKDAETSPPVRKSAADSTQVSENNVSVEKDTQVNILKKDTTLVSKLLKYKPPSALFH